MKTAITAFGIGVAGLIVPFAFVYNPELLLEGSAGAIVIATVTSFIGVLGIAAAIQGWIKQEISVPLRFLLFASAVAAFSHIPAAYIPGAILICLYVLIFHVRRKSPGKRP